MILMADGGVAPIERVVVGATVIGRQGRANRVVGVQRAVLGVRRLYALNGGRCFVTADHPFMTPVGWKAIDREAIRTGGSDLKVGRLVPGDAVALRRATESAAVSGQLALAATSEAELGFEAVTRLRSCRADPATPLYDLLLDGDHSYFADGYLVHDNVAGGHGHTLTAVRAVSPGNRERHSHSRLRKPGIS